MPRTWRWVASYFGKHKLARKHPTDTTVAQQLRQAIRLRDMPGGGLRHWVCGWAYGTGSKWLWVWNEKPSPHPRRCARNLRRHHGVTPSSSSGCFTRMM